MTFVTKLLVKLDFEVMVIIVGTSMNVMKGHTGTDFERIAYISLLTAHFLLNLIQVASTMHFVTIPMAVLNVNAKLIGFYERMIPNVDQMFVLMVIMDKACIANRCRIMLNARKKVHMVPGRSLVVR